MDSALQTLTVRRLSTSSDLAKQGDYVLVPKREPIRRYEPVAGSPAGFWARLLWVVTGRKPLVKEVVEALWPEYDAIILNCPQCNQPCATSKDHKIVSVEPLGIDRPIACPYCRAAFKVTDGTLTTA
jgi:uncharacterized protein YbaR (Trm112 family)